MAFACRFGRLGMRSLRRAVGGPMRDGARAGVLGLIVMSWGCATTKTSTQQVQVLERERYSLVDSQKPAIVSQWRQSGDRVVGEVRVESCRVDRTWELAELEITRRPNDLAWRLYTGAGVGFLSASTTILLTSGDEAIALPLAGLGAAALIGAVVTGANRSAVKYERTNVRKKTTTEVGACLRRLDSPALVLALKLPNGKGVPVRLNAAGRGTIVLPPDYPAPTGVDLPVVIHRFPEVASGVLKRGQVIGTVRLEPRAESAPRGR